MHQIAQEALEGYRPFLLGGVRVILLLAAGILVTAIINRSIQAIRSWSVRLMTRSATAHPLEVEKRATTISSVIRRSLLTLLWAALVIMALDELGFKIGGLLAGAGISAGIIGVALGFGAQSLIKDLIGGLFLLLENQIRVKDIAIINGTSGSVEEINLRTTVLRGENGAVHIIPNGSIQTLANLTREYSFYVFEIAINYDQDPDQATRIMSQIASELRADATYGPLILADLEMMGVDRLTVTGAVIKARIKTMPMKQWMVGREMNRLIRARFLAEHLDLTASPTVVRLEQTQ